VGARRGRYLRLEARAGPFLRCSTGTLQLGRECPPAEIGRRKSSRSMRLLSFDRELPELADLPPAERDRLWYQARQDAQRTRSFVAWSLVAGLVAGVSARLDRTGVIAGVTAAVLISWLALRVQTRREARAACARGVGMGSGDAQIVGITARADAATEALRAEFRRRLRSASVASYVGIAILASYWLGLWWWWTKNHGGTQLFNRQIAAYGLVSVVAFFGLVTLSGWLARCPRCGTNSKLNSRAGAYCPHCGVLLRPEARRVGCHVPGESSAAECFTGAVRRAIRWRTPVAIVFGLAGVIAVSPILGIVPVTHAYFFYVAPMLPFAGILAALTLAVVIIRCPHCDGYIREVDPRFCLHCAISLADATRATRAGLRAYRTTAIAAPVIAVALCLVPLWRVAQTPAMIYRLLIPGDSFGTSGLILAVAAHDADAVRQLLATGADPNDHGRSLSALDAAIHVGAQEIMKDLLRHGANPNGPGNDGEPLRAAIFADRLPMVEALLDAGAATEPPGAAVTPLAYASYLGNAEMVKLLLRQGANPNGGRTCNPLVDAASVEIVAELLNAGAQVDGGVRCTASPLIAAAKHGQIGVARALLAAGARVDAVVAPAPPFGRTDCPPDPDAGKTALEVARAYGHTDVAALLEEAQRRP
jgi:ankyrin repeat protein